MSRITVKDDAAGESARKAWMEMCSLAGKETVGGQSIDGDSKTGVGLIGWDSLEEAYALKAVPGVGEAWEKYRSFGDCKGVMVKLEVY